MGQEGDGEAFKGSQPKMKNLSDLHSDLEMKEITFLKMYFPDKRPILYPCTHTLIYP